MALHTELDIYKNAYAMLRLSLVGLRNMPRDFKQSLGRRIHDECIDVLMLIAEANQLPDAHRIPVIQAMLQRVGKIEFLLRVCNDERLISPKVWAQAIETLQALGHKGGGWLRYTRGRARTEAPAA